MNERINTKTTEELCEKLWIGLVTTMTKNYVEKGVPLIRNSDIKPNKIESNLINLDYEFANLHKGRTLKIDDVVTVHTGDVGVSAIIQEELDGAHGFATINSRLKKEIIIPEYYCWFLNSHFFLQQVYQVITGDGRNNLNLNDFVNLKVQYPELPTQRKIAHILSTADAVIEKTQATIAKYKAIKQGMLHDLFTRGIDTSTACPPDRRGKLRPKYEDAPELYKKSKLGWIPKEWETNIIGKISSLVTNGFVGVATPYYTTANKGVPYLFGTNIREDKIEFNDLRYISREFHTNHVKSQLKAGDMLCVQSGHIGTCAVVPKKFVEANCHALIITRFYQDTIYPEFISFYLNSSIGRHQLDKIIIGSTIKHINTSDLAKHLIPIPPVDEQKLISKRLNIIDNKIQTEQTYLHKLQQIKSGLMADLLSGRKEVAL